MTAVILHVTDIHIKGSSDLILRQGASIASAMFEFLPSASHVFIVCSGDVAYSGSSDEYDAAFEFFSSISATIQSEADCPISFIFSPGNHDCNFRNDSGVRKALIERFECSTLSDVDDSIVDACTKVQSEFFSFRDLMEENKFVSDDKLWRSSVFEVEGKTIAFECLNISWVSKIHEAVGKIFYPIERYSSIQLEHADVRLVVMHHPLNWFNQSIYRPFRNFIRKLADIVITGHEHQSTVGQIDDAESNISAYIEGGALQHNSKSLLGSSFNVTVLDLSLGQFSSVKYEWGGDRYVANEDSSWADYHALPVKSKNPFDISPSFQEMLDDPGAFFKHPSRANVGLSDIYVYPDLRKVGGGEDRRRVFISSSKLLSPEFITDGILIEGEEKTGCTSLLYQLYRQYHERGFFPLYIKGRDLKRSVDADIDRLIKRSIGEQYGVGQIASFTQLPSAKKMLLLDDFDSSPICSGEARASLLCALRKRFGNFVVIVSDMFEIREMLDGDASRALTQLAHYKIQPFGHKLRSELISRWILLGADGTLDEGGVIARLDQAEKLMNAVIQKAVIPAIPLYLLTLLQSIDAGRSGDFKESSHGYYYQYLLTEAFQDSGVKPDKLTEIFHYSACLAWAFHLLDKRELSESDLRVFNSQFSHEWHTVDFSSRLEVLLNSRVLFKVGDDYAFRYPYIYYYLKGKFLSDNLSDPSVREYIKHCCQHLYVREHANTVLFLAHHSNDDLLLRSIADALHNLFSHREPVRFDGNDTNAISKLIQDAPELTYVGGKPVENRARRNEFQDEIDDGHDGLLDSEESEKELSLFAQMTMLFKTTEILGQILKNQYSKIQRSRKKDLLQDLFNGPLRAISDFYSFFESNPDALVVEIEATLLRKGKLNNSKDNRDYVRKVAARLIQFVTFSFFVRSVQSVNSESLYEDVRDVVNEVNTPAFRIIEMGVKLDSPRSIPRSDLKRLFTDVKGDPVASCVIQFMILNRLYMFKTSEQDMQWLSQEANIELAAQHSIAYQGSRNQIK